MILNKKSTGIIELKELIGFIHKSINFDNMISYIGFAERHIQKVIGKEVFATAENHYNSDNYKLVIPNKDHPEYSILDDLVSKIQFPVSINAYRHYVPSLDLIHSDKGRQIFVTNEEKPAFEWQIEKDNENLIRLENEGIDFLLEFLDEHIDDKSATGNDPPEYIPWGTSDAYKSSRDLLIFKVDQLERIFSIKGSRLVYLSLCPFIRLVQDNEIRSCFTEENWSALKEQILDDDLSQENKIIIDLARQPLALLALSMAIRRLSVELLPDGLFTNQVTGVIKSRDKTMKIDRVEVSFMLEKDGIKQLKKLQDAIKANEMKSAGTIYVPVDLTERIKADKDFVRF
jgi:hypothetical protein